MVDAIRSDGWETYVIGTPSSAAWIDPELVTALDVSFDFRTPHATKNIPTPDVVVVCPATFNTVNKLVAGIADNYAASLVCEALGAGTPVVIAPMVNQKLWGHPQWRHSLAALQQSKVQLVDPETGGSNVQPVKSGTGDEVVSGFRPLWLLSAMQRALSPT
jgi:phosphopantothenoylcysteine synthetase/decarboxylase